MEPVYNLLGNQGGVAAGAVVDEEVDLDLVLKLISPSDRKSCSKAQSLPPSFWDYRKVYLASTIYIS
jgi:hypothetical protein